MRSKWTRQALPLLGAALLAGCVDDGDEVLTGPAPVGNAAFMARYVSLGNSLTAGMQSAGISDSTQQRAYPVLIAKQAGVASRFFYPALADPGCPAPYVAPVFFDTTRVGAVGGKNPPPCSLRRGPAPPYLNNVAYTGSFVAGAIDNSVDANPASANLYKTIFLGGRTQVEAMADAQPTLVSVWLGNNETLVPAIAANLNAFVPQAGFESSLDSIARAIQNTPARDHAVLIAPVNALTLTPLVQPGTYLFVASQDPGFAALLAARGKTVSPDCSPLAKGGNLVSLRVVLEAPIPVISCADNAPGVMTPAFATGYNQRVNAYKAAVRARAEANGWIYIDPDVELAASLADPGKFRKCQGLRTAQTLLEIQQAVKNTCPTDPTNFFGSHISFDGTHPASPAHVEIANVIIRALNTKYGSSIPTI